MEEQWPVVPHHVELRVFILQFLVDEHANGENQIQLTAILDRLKGSRSKLTTYDEMTLRQVIERMRLAGLIRPTYQPTDTDDHIGAFEGRTFYEISEGGIEYLKTNRRD